MNNNDHDILFNFTQIANRVLIVNISSMCVVSNMMINPETYSNVDEEFMTLMKSFVSLFFEKKWTLSQYNLLKKLIIDINNDKNNFGTTDSKNKIIYINNKLIDDFCNNKKSIPKSEDAFTK